LQTPAWKTGKENGENYMSVRETGGEGGKWLEWPGIVTSDML